MSQKQLLDLLSEKLLDLGFDYDYDCLSQSGQQTYDEIVVIVAQLKQ